MILCDMHSHTMFSFDAGGTVDSFCEYAAKSGLKYFAVTEHYDYDDHGGELHYEQCKTQRLEEMAAAKEKWSDQFTLLCGIELGQPHFEPEVSRAHANCGDYDVVIGSVHEIRPGLEIYGGRLDFSTISSCDDIMERYFAEALEIVENCDIDIFAHYDFALRLMTGTITPQIMVRWRPLMQKFLRALASSGIALEINTSGHRRHGLPLGEPWVFEDFKKYGGRRISVGSDAHRPQEVGSFIKEAYASLRAAGFYEVVVFENRIPKEISII